MAGPVQTPYGIALSGLAPAAIFPRLEGPACMRPGSVLWQAAPYPTHLTATMFEHTEHLVRLSVEWLRLFVEALGAAVIFFGLIATLRVLLRTFTVDREAGFGKARITFARFLTLALELQLAADILSTSVSPSWDQIGKLAAIAVIRTALNYFLMQEMKEEERNPGRALP
jgi:uncharacterized membrane protein